MPLSLGASLALGCVVKVVPHAASKALTSDFSVSDFKVRACRDPGHAGTLAAPARRCLRRLRCL